VKLATRAVVWVLAYLGVVVAPLVFAVIGSSQPDHGFRTNFSVALGFTGLAMMGLEFALVARFNALMLRGLENPNQIFVRIEFDSADDARAFRNKVRDSDVLQNVTVKVPPTVAETADRASY
jgi:hypothetical protein